MTYCYQCVAWHLGHCYKEGNNTAYNDTCNGVTSIKELYEKEKRNAVKEFAEKLKSKLNDYHDGGEKGAYLTENDINEILKEFTK